AGKSTIGLEILGLLGFKGGQRVGGNIVTDIAVEKMAYIPQDPLAALDPLFSIGHQMGEMAGSKSEIEDALRRVHLSLAKISLKSYPHELSGGMRQRVLIAMALLRRPMLIVADEPTSSLDVTLQAEIMELFREIRAAGISFLFITHNLPLAASFCDRVALLRLGKIVEMGECRDIFQNPREVYTKTLVESVPKIRL
ncbi:MAG: ATP-binding cassette domain-containing protein, partial [Candidatus Omnitrophica bacterium]|nr:ATP-binding cassette domain-containing protein [Candidatus Omnitrophota bacterium]